MERVNNETNCFKTDDDRLKELKLFDDTKMGVKGLIDSGVKTIPKIFIRSIEELLDEEETHGVKLQIPVIDLGGVVKNDGYNEIVVKQVVNVLQEWGFFQVINHGIPQQVIDNMIKGMRMFHEQDGETKKELYSRDNTKTVTYQSNFDLYKARSASWRDTFAVHAKYSTLDPKEIPQICREVVMDYINQVLKLGDTLMELISVSLGLKPSYLKEELEVSKGWDLVNHYYPACPAPELTQGACKHTDPSFITILMQDQIGGLQVLYEDKWVPVEPIPGAFVINIGDILQMVTNDKFKSVYHRVKANKVGPRISVAFFLKGDMSSSKLYGPIKELFSENNPPIYREFTSNEFVTRYFTRPFGENIFEHFKLK